MNQREFNKAINACRNKAKTAIDIGKIKALPDDTKTRMVNFIVRNRGPILSALLTKETDRAWLSSCGYMYASVGQQSGLSFLHTSEHRIR